MSTLAERIDALTEAAFWDGEDLDAITDAILLSWFEVMSARYSTKQIAAALRSAADDLRKSTLH